MHVVERVLLPPALVGAAEREAARGAARRLIARAIERGAPPFNAGREEECRAVCEQAAATLLERPDEALGLRGEGEGCARAP